MGNIEKSLDWFEDRIGKVSYSMARRNGPRSYDCSSALYTALRAGGFPLRITWNGNTENLFKEAGYLLEEISYFERKRGDIFIAGVEGNSAGSFGHTGMVWSRHQIIHCNATDNGIRITPIFARTGQPCRWFRIKHCYIDHPTSTPIVNHVGQLAQVKKDAKRYQTGEKIAPFVKGKSYMVIQQRHDQKSNQQAYLLSGIYSWVLEKDIRW
ncbi:peptidoglycan hydrolase [Granulicatella balaenopterae]|uniref:Peptidoglycan hydrolase n=1 Tax=Granulicatella balaenopterae TaxID=137733 RepID=A0A1H9K3P7_9LACT|nr:peptidoglycan amidohydrolase family protein [Granulicatella balaenopterae]SEQ93699.1 peptidoglycan hydrolase [Granulicatella balaenopterae]